MVNSQGRILSFEQAHTQLDYQKLRVRCFHFLNAFKQELILPLEQVKILDQLEYR